MLKNYTDIDVKKLCKESETTQREVALKLGLSKAAVSKRASGQVVNKGFIELCETLGYDIEIKYIKR